ncbi:MAG: hypothetical protein AAF517_12405 [Planctomycetota bacterium]
MSQVSTTSDAKLSIEPEKFRSALYRVISWGCVGMALFAVYFLTPSEEQQISFNSSGPAEDRAFSFLFLGLFAGLLWLFVVRFLVTHSGLPPVIDRRVRRFAFLVTALFTSLLLCIVDAGEALTDFGRFKEALVDFGCPAIGFLMFWIFTDHSGNDRRSEGAERPKSEEGEVGIADSKET